MSADNFTVNITTAPASYVTNIQEAKDGKDGNSYPNRAIRLAGNFCAAYIASSYVSLLDMARMPDVYPNGITITSWYVNGLNNPTTQLAADLVYCDSTFPPSDATTVATLDTTGGTASSTVSHVIPAAKILYMFFDSAPTESWAIVINYTIN